MISRTEIRKTKTARRKPANVRLPIGELPYLETHRVNRRLGLDDPRIQYGLLAGITLLAVLLRFYKLGEWSFWGDELYTIRDANRAWQDLGKSSITFALTGIVLSGLGVSEWTARLVPALVGVISIPILYFPARKMFDPAVALVAALLLAVAPWHLYWSQNARFYTSLLLFYTLALFTFYFGFEKDRPLYLLASLVLVGIAAQERLFALFFGPVVVLYLIFVAVLPIPKPAGLRPRNLILFFGPSLLGALYFVWPHLTNWSGWLSIFGRSNNNPFWIAAGVVFYVGTPVIALGFFGMLYLFTKGQRAAILLGASALVPPIAVMGISLVQYAANRYTFVSLTSWILLASVAVVYLIRDTATSARLLAVGVFCLLIFDAFGQNALYYVYQNGNRDNWKGAFDVIKENRQPGDTVVSSHTLVGDYYMQEETANLFFFDLDTAGTTGKRVWFVEDMNVQDLAPEKHTWLEKNAKLIANLDVHVQARNFRMRVYLYEPAGAASSGING